MSKLDELKAQKAEIERQIAMVESYRPGQKWQYKALPGYAEEGTWQDSGGEPCWRFDKLYYRQKPEPMVIFVNIYEQGYVPCIYTSSQEALNNASNNVIRAAVPFKEVIE